MDNNMTKISSILILIIFIISSILIIPFLWTIPGFILYSRINQGQASEGQKIAYAILGIIFGAVLGIVGGILILVDLQNHKDSKEYAINQNDIESNKTEIKA